MVLKMVARDTMMKTNDWCILFNQKLLRNCHGRNAESLELSDSDMAISEGGLVEQNTAQIFFFIFVLWFLLNLYLIEYYSFFHIAV